METNKRIALVTGGNRGIGFEVCRQLAQKDIHVILTSRNKEKGLEATALLRDAGLPVEYHALDVSDFYTIEEIFSFVTSRFGRLDVLVNNAGILADPPRHPPQKEEASIFWTPIQTIRTSLETNTFGAIHLIQKFAPLMSKNNYGRIVNVSSGMGQLSDMNGGWPGYRISKVALNAVTRIAADELQGSNILINSVCPGWVRTRMGGPEADLSPAEGADTIVWLATLPDGGPSGGFFRERQSIQW